MLRWFLFLIACGVLFGPAHLEASYATRERWGDFYQEWFSARNVLHGGRAYAPLPELARRYTDLPDEYAAKLLPWNAHPPVSVLLALPLGRLGFQDALTVWNLLNWPLFVLSLVLIIRGLRIPFSASSLLPTLALSLACYPLYLQVQHGQLNIVLMAGITLSWYLDRLGYRIGAGAALGAVAAFKLVPAFLFLYFLGTRRWRSLAVAVGVFGALNGLAVAVLGIADVRVYLYTVVPSVANYVSSRFNLSLAGFWLRIFDPHPNEHVDAIVVAPVAGAVLSYLTRAAVIGWVLWQAYTARTLFDRDRAFAVAMVGMFLVSPITWDHYFLILGLPFALAWWHVQGIAWRVLFWVIFLRTWLPNYYIPSLVIGQEVGTAKYLFGSYQLAAVENLWLASLPFYGLVAFFVLVANLRERTPVAASPVPAGGGP